MIRTVGFIRKMRLDVGSQMRGLAQTGFVTFGEGAQLISGSLLQVNNFTLQVIILRLHDEPHEVTKVRLRWRGKTFSHLGTH